LRQNKENQKAFDVRSIHFRVWLYFVAFATALLLVLWGLQIFFLNNYYQDMKINETNRVASVITTQYKSENIIDIIRNLSYSNDMYIHIETTDGTIVFSPITEEGRRPSYGYIGEMEAMKEQLFASGNVSISSLIPEGRSDMNTLAYAGFVEDASDNQAILYIFSPLYPVSSTVAILQEQLKYITIISLAMAFAISIYLSRRISRPIRRINDQAISLAQGEYGITFEGGTYSEITNLAKTLTHASEELAKSDQLQKDLIANVSHDIRTPLTMVKSYAELVRDISGEDRDKREEHLQVIIEEADRLNRLVTDMLTLSKIQAGVGLLDITEFNLSETISRVVQPYAEIMREEGYTIETSIEDSLWIRADQARIKQVISNLLSNAIKYCGKDKIVFVRGFLKGEYVRFEVEDRGMGIRKEDLTQIWERYQKGSTNHVRHTSGTGLGLSIVKEILTLHKAEFGVKSHLGEGALFWFELPRM
jgi:signal transduction histidine kinase